MGKLENFQTLEYLENFAKENGFEGFMQTSAKENTNLKEAFEKIVDIILKSGRIKPQQKTTGNFAPKPKTETSNTNNAQEE